MVMYSQIEKALALFQRWVEAHEKANDLAIAHFDVAYKGMNAELERLDMEMERHKWAREEREVQQEERRIRKALRNGGVVEWADVETGE